MPKLLFYVGTAFCLFLALSSATGAVRQWQGGDISFVALSGTAVSTTTPSAWAIVVALVAGVACAAMLLRMAALLAPRNLFGAFLALLSVTAGVLSLAWVMLMQSRLLVLARRGDPLTPISAEMHFAGTMMAGYFLSLSFLALRPYFRVQASRVLSALVLFPLPLFVLIHVQDLFVGASIAPLPARSPASIVFFAVVSVLFFAIAVHCIRHRHMFIELTNLRELLDSRVDPAARPSGGRPVRVAFDS